MHRRHPLLDRAHQIRITGDRQIRIDTTLHTHLGGALDMCLPGPLGDLVGGQGEGVGITLALGESTEPAAGVADIGEVDIAVHHVGDIVADGIAAQLIGQCGDRVEFGTVGGGQCQVLGIGESGRILFRGPQRTQHIGIELHRRRQRKDLFANGFPIAERAQPIALESRVAARVGVAALGVDRGIEVGAAQ